jgi:hypothetical protein
MGSSFVYLCNIRGRWNGGGNLVATGVYFKLTHTGFGRIQLQVGTVGVWIVQTCEKSTSHSDTSCSWFQVVIDSQQKTRANPTESGGRTFGKWTLNIPWTYYHIILYILSWLQNTEPQFATCGIGSTRSTSDPIERHDLGGDGIVVGWLPVLQ